MVRFLRHSFSEYSSMSVEASQQNDIRRYVMLGISRLVLGCVLAMISPIGGAAYNLTTTTAYSDSVQVGTGSQKSDSGTVKVAASVSGNSIVFSFSSSQGKSFTYQIAGAVYRDSYSSSNLVAKNTAGAGSAGVTVSIPAVAGNYKVLLATQTSTGTNVGFYFNSALFGVTQTNSPPTTPTGFTASNTGTNTGLLTWSASSDPEGDSISYRLQVSSDGYNWGNDKVVTGTSDPLNTTGLAGKTISLRIRAEDSRGNVSGWSATTLTVSSAVNQPPTIPTGFTASNTGTNTGLLTWSASSDPEGDSISYRLQVSSDGYNWGNDKVVTGTSDPLNTTGLAGKTISLRIRAEDSRGNVSGWSATTLTVSITTFPSVTEAIRPNVVKVNQLATFTVAGQNLPDGIVMTVESCSSVTEMSGGSSTLRKFQCTPTAIGFKQIQLKTQSGMLFYSSSVQVTDKTVLPAPTITISPSASAPAGTRMTVSWAPVDGADGYSLSFTQQKATQSTGKWVGGNIPLGASTSYSFDMPTGMDVSVVVIAYKSSGGDYQPEVSNQISIKASGGGTPTPRFTGITQTRFDVHGTNKNATFELTGSNLNPWLVVTIDGCLNNGYTGENLGGTDSKLILGCQVANVGQSNVTVRGTDGTVIWNSTVAISDQVGVKTLAAPKITLTPAMPAPVGSQIKLSFAPVDGATTYELCVGKSSGDYSIECVSVNSGDQGNTFTLQDGWDYYVAVRAGKDGVKSRFSNEGHVVASTFPAFGISVSSQQVAAGGPLTLNASNGTIATCKSSDPAIIVTVAADGATATGVIAADAAENSQATITCTSQRLPPTMATATVAIVGTDTYGDMAPEFDVDENGDYNSYGINVTLTPLTPDGKGKVFAGYRLDSGGGGYFFLKQNQSWEQYDHATRVDQQYYFDGKLAGLNVPLFSGLDLGKLPNGKLIAAYIDPTEGLRVITLLKGTVPGSNTFSASTACSSDFYDYCFIYNKGDINGDELDDTLEVTGFGKRFVKRQFLHFDGFHPRKALSAAVLANLAYRTDIVTGMQTFAKLNGLSSPKVTRIVMPGGNYSKQAKVNGDAVSTFVYEWNSRATQLYIPFVATPVPSGPSSDPAEFQFLTGYVVNSRKQIKNEMNQLTSKPGGHIEYYLAIRGTSNSFDVHLDAYAAARYDFQNLGKQYPVHAGFSFYADEVIAHQNFKNLIAHFSSNICTKLYSCGLTIAGHSLGGAVASLIRAHLVNEINIGRITSLKPDQIDVYTIGSPFPFAAKSDGEVPDLTEFSKNNYRTVNVADPVPKVGVPTWKCNLGMDSNCHVGTPYYFEQQAYGRWMFGTTPTNTGIDIGAHSSGDYLGMLNAFGITKTSMRYSKGANRKYY